ncbi:hypothetical protein [Halomonas faecis]|uniref:hypothetical protein n=1 Tax=Halomonas faecis TaxID=1562110 RepID=UPI0013D6DCC6|nr:hypothetical protein [Halomonas faecis]
MDKFNARYAYESLILMQSHIEFAGLWTKGDRFLISCPSLDKNPLTSDGKPLRDWFHYSCRPVCCPVEIASDVPEGYEQINERSESELARLFGEPLTLSELYRELYITLPKSFPLSAIESGAGKVVVSVNRLLTQNEENEMNIAFANIGIDFDIEVVDPSEHSEPNKDKALKESSDKLTLILSERIKDRVPNSVLSSYEEDEEFWVDNRVNVFSSDIYSREDVLQPSFLKTTSACFIDATAFPPKNIRNYLPIYQRLVISMPLATHFVSALEAFNVHETELLDLVARGRVQFILPQSIQRYNLNFIAKAIEIDPNSVLLSRRLAAASVAETRARLPFLYPPFGASAKRDLLRLLVSVSEPKIKPVGEVLARSLAQGWVGMERNISNRGGMGTANNGIGTILGELIHTMSGRDLRLELITSSMSVEWAAAVGATYCPIENEGYSDFNAANLCASLYSGVENAPLLNPVKSLEPFMEGLLTLNNDAPVLEVDDVFTSSDIDRLGGYLRGVTGLEDPSEEIAALNERIRRFEHNQDRINRLDILGLGGVAVATAMTGNPYVPFGLWIAQYILKNADPSRDIGGKAIDWIRAMNTRSSTDAVLVSRLRSKIQDL